MFTVGVRGHGDLLLIGEQATGAQAAAPIRLEKVGAVQVAWTVRGGAAGGGDGQLYCSLIIRLNFH